MKDLGTVRLHTERLLLRPFDKTDAEAMYRNWASEPEVTKYLTWPTHESVEVSRAVLADWTSHYGEPGFYQWAIVPADVGEPIGSIAVVQRNEQAQSVHIGYCIGARWWRRGYVGEALSEVIRFFFEEVGAQRVDSRHDANNPNSGRVMRHCGMTCEGVLRRSDWNNQGVVDAVWYGLLAEEYFARKLLRAQAETAAK